MITLRSCAAACWTSRLIAVLPPTSASAPGTACTAGPDPADRGVGGLAVRRRGQRPLQVGVAVPDHRGGHAGDARSGPERRLQPGRRRLVADYHDRLPAAAGKCWSSTCWPTTESG